MSLQRIRFPKPILVVICSFVIFISTNAQTTDFFLKSPDGELAIELSREQQSVNIALFISNAQQFESVSIERSLDSQNNFGQCKFIQFNQSAQPNVVIVKKDAFPLTYVDEVYYRVKTISTDGVTRIYPSVRLPGIREASLY